MSRQVMFSPLFIAWYSFTKFFPTTGTILRCAVSTVLEEDIYQNPYEMNDIGVAFWTNAGPHQSLAPSNDAVMIC